MTTPDDEAVPGEHPDEAEGPPDGYAWDLERQERDLPPEEYRSHLAILDDLEEEELERLDLSRAGDYVLWAAAQALDEIGRRDRAIDALRRIAASTVPHPALDYPVIMMRLAELLTEIGDYADALEVLERVERRDRGLRDSCRERRAGILVLSGREGEGLRLFEKALRRARGDPWVPLAAAWALIQRGRYDQALSWIDRAESEESRAAGGTGRGEGRDRAAGSAGPGGDHDEAPRARAEIERLREEVRARSERRQDPPDSATAVVQPDGDSRLAALRREILSALDQEEMRLVDRPPRGPDDRARAEERLTVLVHRASHAWDDAVEAGDEAMIAAFDDLQGEIAGLAERFGVELPDPDED